ncbi:glycosyl transferase [Intrasporangium chromatireducens Q5-1]|uniref:Glycosyl transferase n=1 Tax=Intrasporangium chromatireducens Q5-1 TaxID=584657 RepID=W9GF11_9MICO|nr:glycosyltransferase family 2 protein [Intrasporangium chromatireducens]EWT04801.1 glycosyl transferase [Intrasporangium chromatireducens Q5-1]
MTAAVDVLIPTCERPQALAVTLSGLASQSHDGFRILVSDQSAQAVADDPLVAGMRRVLELHGTEVIIERHVARRGVAENRQHLLELSRAPHVLCLDDDVWLEPWALERLVDAIDELDCGFVGFAVQGLSYRDDHRPHQLSAYEEWPGRVEPERVRRGTPAWDRHLLHNAANPTHLAESLRLEPSDWRAYKVAWIGGCVLYRRAALLEAGGFSFWPDLPPEHAGEDVVPQLRVMERHGGAGLLPSGAVHLELPTTVPHRDVECYDVVGL